MKEIRLQKKMTKDGKRVLSDCSLCGTGELMREASCDFWQRKRPGHLDFSGPLWDVLDRWKSAQQAVGTQAQSLFEGWLKCRTADIEQGMRFYRDMANCHDAMAILSLQQRWLLDAATRLQAEFQELGGKVATAAQQGLAGERDKQD